MLSLKVLQHDGVYYWLILREVSGKSLPEEVEESKTTYLNRLRCEYAGEKRLAELQAAAAENQ